MNKRQRQSWQRFMKSGRILDYLQYRRNETDSIQPDPLRRIEDSSAYKRFY